MTSNASGPQRSKRERAPLTRLVGVRLSESDYEQAAALAAERNITTPELLRIGLTMLGFAQGARS